MHALGVDRSAPLGNKSSSMAKSKSRAALPGMRTPVDDVLTADVLMKPRLAPLSAPASGHAPLGRPTSSSLDRRSGSLTLDAHEFAGDASARSESEASYQFRQFGAFLSHCAHVCAALSLVSTEHRG
jgi:hypothetical protein